MATARRTSLEVEKNAADFSIRVATLPYLRKRALCAPFPGRVASQGLLSLARTAPSLRTVRGARCCFA
jgi:hypothetical protein